MFGLQNLSIELLSDTLWLDIIAGIILLTLAVYLYLRTNPPITKSLQFLFVTLRVISILALLAVLFEPIISYERTFTRKQQVAVLLDESKSLDKIENDLSRQARRDSLLSSDEFAQINAQTDIMTFYFGENISDKKNEVAPDATALADAVLYTTQNQSDNNFDYQIIFSDGNSNTGRKVSDISTLLKTKTYAVDVSQGGKKFDLSIKDVDYNPVIFADRATEIAVKLEWKNAVPQTIPIQLLDSTKVVAQTTININQSEGLSEQTIKYSPTTPGQKFLKVRAGSNETEENKSNNNNSFAVQVLKSKLSILILSENPDYELSFLKKYLDRSDKFDLDMRLLGSKSGNLKGSIPSSQSELNAFDLVILHDVHPELLESKKELFDSFVADKGGSLWFLLGSNYAQSQTSPWLNSLLPFYAANNSDLMTRSFHAEPSEGNLYHPSIRLADNQASIRKAWAELPPFELLTRCETVAQNATILAYASGLRTRNGDQFPIIGFSRKGAGKIFATAAQPFWNFGFLSLGFGETNSMYSTFLDGTINWLTVDDDLEPIRILPTKDIFSRGEHVRFEGFAYDLGYRPIPDVFGTVALDGNDGTKYQADLLQIEDGKFIAEFQNVKPGRYSYQAQFTKDGRLLKESKGTIEVSTFSLEEYNTDGDPTNLKLIASVSGGSYFNASGFHNLINTIDLTPKQIIKKAEIPIWNKLLLLIIFISALSLEWLLRKLNQLI